MSNKSLANICAKHGFPEAVVDAMKKIPTVEVNELTGVIKFLMPDGTYVSIPKQSDNEIDYVAFGLTLPSSGTIGVAAIDAGVAYISGFRIPHAGSVLLLGATKDNYVDIDIDGNIVVTQVTVAAAAPAIAANSLRLGKLTTNATTITARSVRAKDSNGNWMFNEHPKAYVSATGPGLLVPFGSDVAQQFGAGTTSFDNAGMHSETVNTTRFTAQQKGIYDIDAGVIIPAGGASQTYVAKLFKNGSSASLGTMSANATSTYALRCGGKVPLLVGEYVELMLNFATANVTIAATWFNATKVD